MKLSRVLLGLLLAALFIVPLTASAQPAEISVFFHSGRGAERDALDTILTNFNDSQSDYVAVATELPEGSYTDAVNAAALSGDLPCLLDFDGPTLYSFAWRGYLIPIDSYASEDLLADILPSIIDQGTYNGHLYSLGVFDSGLAIWGNKAMLEAAGVRIPTGLDDVWTLDEFDAALAALKEAHPDNFTLDLKMNYGEGEWFTYGFSPILQGFGADLIDRETYATAEGVLNGEVAVAAMTWFQDLFDKGYATTTPPDDNEFINGNAALSWVGHWEYNRYATELGDNLVLIPMPNLGARAATGMGSWNWGITSQCENQDGAWSLLEFMLDPEQMTIMTDANGAVPSRISVLDADPNYATGGDLNIFVQQLQGSVAVPRPQTPAYPVITREFATAISEISTGADVQDTLDSAVDAIDADIAANDGYPAPSM